MFESYCISGLLYCLWKLKFHKPSFPCLFCKPFGLSNTRPNKPSQMRCWRWQGFWKDFEDTFKLLLGGGLFVKTECSLNGADKNQDRTKHCSSRLIFDHFSEIVINGIRFFSLPPPHYNPFHGLKAFPIISDKSFNYSSHFLIPNC